MKRTFYIAPENIVKDDVLLCEFSLHHVCIARADAVSKKLKSLSYYELRNLLEPEKLQDVLYAEEAASPERMIVSSALKNTILIPASQFTEAGGRRMYEAAYGSTGDAVFFNEVPAYNVVLAHAVPQSIMDVLKSTQPTEALHEYAASLQAAADDKSNEKLAVHFTGKEFKVTAVKDGQLQLAQTFFYAAPLDVVYYLLLICGEYGISQSDAVLELSGLISADSAMYKELHQYFSNIQFWKPAANTTLQSDYLPHFFSSMYNLAACAL